MSITPLEFPTISSTSGALGGDLDSLTSGVAGTSGTSGTTGTTGTSAATGVTGPTGPTGVGSEFGDMLVKGLDSLEGMTDNAANLSVKAATGDLTSIHDYTIAASEAQLATQLTVAVRDKAVAAFQQIMTMQI